MFSFYLLLQRLPHGWWPSPSVPDLKPIPGAFRVHSSLPRSLYIDVRSTLFFLVLFCRKLDSSRWVKTSPKSFRLLTLFWRGVKNFGYKFYIYTLSLSDFVLLPISCERYVSTVSRRNLSLTGSGDFTNSEWLNSLSQPYFCFIEFHFYIYPFILNQIL